MMVEDIGEGNFFAQNLDVNLGLSPLCIRPANSINANNLTAQNQMHTLIISGTGISQASMVQMMLLMLTICRRHNRAVANLYTNVVQHFDQFVRQLHAQYTEPA
jgi:hypothetical protein